VEKNKKHLISFRFSCFLSIFIIPLTYYISRFHNMLAEGVEHDATCICQPEDG
jgi:hypothetical protein